MLRSISWFGLAAFVAGASIAAAAQSETLPDKDAIKAELWSKELAIYAGRGRGDMTPYIANTSPDYLGWPPQAKQPLAREDLKASSTATQRGSKEKLEMTFEALTVSRETALIYYKTHMITRADGSPVDLHYEVVHAWVRENGVWRLLGGMARPSIDR